MSACVDCGRPTSSPDGVCDRHRHRASRPVDYGRVYPVDPARVRFAVCGTCCAVLVDDAEGANRRQHYAAMHELEALVDQLDALGARLVETGEDDAITVHRAARAIERLAGE